MKNWLPKRLKIELKRHNENAMVRQVHYRLLVLHASISNKVPDCIQPIGCSNDLTVGSAAHVEFHFSCPPNRIEWTRKNPKQKETNAMPLLCRSSSSEVANDDWPEGSSPQYKNENCNLHISEIELDALSWLQSSTSESAFFFISDRIRC